MLVISIAGILTSLLVTTSFSTVYSVLWLVATFIIVATALAFLNLSFVALLYIIVYIGAIAILFLFVVQLLDLNTQLSWSQLNNKTTGFQTPPLSLTIIFALVIIGSYFFSSLSLSIDQLAISDLLFYTIDDLSTNDSYNYNIFTSMQTLNQSIDVQENVGTLSNLAYWLYGPGMLPLLLISLILLVSMIAPIFLCL